MRNLFDSGVVESFKKTVWKQNEEAKRKDFWTQDAVEGENSLPREQEDRRKAEEEEEIKAWSYESPDTQSMIGSDGVYEGRNPLPKRNMKWQTRGDLRPQAGRNAQLNVPDESGHVDLRPPIVNRPQVGPEAQLNFLSDEQANEMQRQLEERDGGVHRVPGSGIMNDRQYWRVLNDWRMAGVDSPHYYVERAALRRYEKNRGIDEGSVAAAGDVRKARAWQLLAEIGDGADLDAGQEQEVDQVLGAGTVKFYRGLSQEEKDEVLVDGYDRAFVGASTSLGRAYLAQKLGLDTDEASVMAAELRRQAGVGRARREQVKKDMEDVWGEIVAATGSGKEFSLDPHDHQGRSPEFLAGAARMAESQKKAAALIREFAYGEDGKSPHAQGVRTGVTGVRVMGFSKEGDGSWLVSKLVELNREDPVAYQMALEAVQGLVMKDSDEHGLMNRYFESLPWGGLAKKGMQLMLKPELHKNIFNAASNVAGMAGEAVLGTMRAASHKKMMADAERRKRLKAGGAMTPGDYMLWRKAQENPNVLNGPEVNDPQWVQRVNQVAQDLQRVRMGQFQSRGKTVLGRFIEDAGSVVGGAVSFMASFGVLPVLQTMEQEETEYLAKGAEPAKAALAAMGEGVGMWAANIWGLGKGGKLVGKAYDKLMNWAGKKAGYRGLLARALETDRWWGRGPLFVGMEGVVLHSQTVMEPYARYLASNMFTGGDGKSFNEALAEAKEAMTWRNFLVGLPMSVLLGYGRYAQNSPFRASQAAIAEFNRMKLEWADSREAMEGGGFAEADIKAILNAKNDGERLKLFDLGLERSEMMKMVREGKANVENDIALMIVPDSNEANMLMEMGAIPRFEIVDGKVRVYGAESMDFKGQKEEVSARDSVGAEPGKEIKEESGGENEGQERRRRTDYVEFNMDEAGYYLTAKAREWYSNQDFTLKNAVLGNEAVDYFAKRCDVQFEKSGELMTRRYLERMADEALNRVNERRHSKDMWSREEADAQEEDVVLSVLPGSFRNRVEVAMKRNELSRNPQETGKITQREIDARSGDYGVHTPAFNYELECGKKVIRYYEGEATFLDLVEEMAELYVKGEIKAGRELGWFAGNLKETQEAFKAQGVRHWMLADVDLLDGKSGVKKQELAVVEGMSKLMQAVHVGEFRKRKLPESVQRFLEIAMALLRKVADMAGLAGAFRKAVDSGAVKGDFAAFVYDAVGADFIQTRYDAGKREFQKRLNEIKGKPERMLGFYDLHVAYAEQYGLENYLYQLEHPDTDKLQSDSKFLNFVGEKMKREFEAQGREFFEKMKGASLQEMKDVLKAARAWNRRYKNIYKLPEEAGKTVSFSITDKLDEMGKDAGKRKVMDFVDMVVSSDVPDKTSLGVVEYRGASVREIADIKAGLGIDVTGMVHEFPAKSIAHALKSHGHDSEAKRSQLNLTKEDIKLALDVLDHYDRVEFKPKGKNLSSVIYVKEYPHGEIHTVEQVIETTGRRSKKPRLTFKTAWVKRTAPAGTEPGVEGVYTPRRRKGSMANEGGNVNSVAEAQEQGLFRDGHFEAGNAVITEPGATFSVREDLLGDMKRQMEKTRSDAVREYWRHVTERLEREELAMRALMLKPKGSDEFLRARIAEARSIMKVAVETLPESVRGKLAGQEQKLERWMKLLEGGAFHPGYTLARHDVERLAVDMGIMPEEMPFFIGKRVDELVLKTYRRAAEVIELYVRDGLFAETRKMISEHEAVIDEKTRKFKVSRLGAAPTEFLRSVIKPAVYATHAAAEKKAAELSERLRMLEMQLNEFKDGKVVSGMDALMKERMRLEGEFNWWMNYSAARSSDVNRMLGIHEAVSAFISRNAEVWQAHLHEKLEGWKKVGKALMDELPKDVNQKNMHLAEAEMTDLGTDSETGRIKRGVLSSWLDNTVNKLQQLGDGPGGEFFRKFKVEFLNVTNRTQALRAQQVEKMHDVMKKLSGATSERMLNQWLAEWDTKVDLGLTLREKGVKKTKLTIDQAAKLLERREKNPWWGVDMYSQKAIDLLREEYEAWGRGENRARKWFEVEEWYDMDPQPMPKLSRDQALFVLMCMDQPNVFDSRIPDRMTPMRRRGWTDEHKMKLEEFIGPEGMALKSILFEEYAQVGDMIRPLYEDRYGVPFSKRRNYSPLRWMVDETRDDSELASILGDDGTIAVGRSDGFLSVRDESHQRYLNTTQGALALFWKHHANAVNWVCTQEMVERYQGILSDPSVAQKLKVNIGALDYRGFQTLINRLEHGGRDAVAELDAAEVVKNRIMNARAVSVLAGQVTSLLRQTTAVFNALHGCDLSTAEWIHGMSRVISGKSVLSVRELFSSDLFQARKDGFMYSVLLGYKKQLGGRLGLLEQLSEKSMNALGWLDAGCNAVSFAAAFDHYFRQGVEQGMSKPEAMEYARDVIEEGLSTAQPTNWTQMPKMLEKTKGIFSEEWFLMSETLQRGATVFSLWKRGKKKLAMRSWLVQGVAMQVLGYLINNVMRPGGDDDEKKNPLNYLPGIVLGPLNGVPFLGRGADWLIEQAADIFDLKVQTRTGIAGSELEFMIKDLTGLFQDLEQVDNWQSVRMKSRGVATLGSITAMLGAWRNPRGGAITSVSLGMAVMANYLKHLAGMAEKWFGE